MAIDSVNNKHHISASKIGGKIGAAAGLAASCVAFKKPAQDMFTTVASKVDTTLQTAYSSGKLKLDTVTSERITKSVLKCFARASKPLLAIGCGITLAGGIFGKSIGALIEKHNAKKNIINEAQKVALDTANEYVDNDFEFYGAD